MLWLLPPAVFLHLTFHEGIFLQIFHQGINEKENWTAFNLEKANALLDNAGYEWKNKKGRVKKDGTPIEFDIIVVSGWSDWVRSAQVISQNLRKVGIKANVRTYDFGDWINGGTNIAKTPKKRMIQLPMNAF